MDRAALGWNRQALIWIGFSVVWFCCVLAIAHFRGGSNTIHIQNGDVFLVQSGSNFGAFRIVSEEQQPEVVSYEYRYRTDSGTDLDEIGEMVFRGTANDKRNISFGPFLFGWSVQWSGHSGWLYLGMFPGGTASPAGVKCVRTKSPDLGSINKEEVKRMVQKYPAP